jgi:hypothetical protein
MISRVSGPVFLFCAPESFSAVPRALGPVLIFCAPRLVFGGIDGLRTYFHVLRAQTRFWPYLRRSRAPFSCFALLDSFSAVSRASGPVFIFCVPVLIFGGSEGVGSRFYALRYPDSFLAVSRALGLIFIFCAPELIFGDTELCQVPFSCFRSRTHFRQCEGRRVPFSCFASPYSFSAVPWASGPVFMICAPRLIFGGAERVDSCFHVSRSQTLFRRYRRRRVPFSCFALLDSFSTLPRASGPILIFCAETHFRRYRRRRVPLSGFARPNSFLAVRTASGPVFMFCALGHVFGGAKGFGFQF